MDIEKLVKKAKRGDKDSFIKLMNFYEKDMFNVSKYMLGGNNESIYDVVQETIITAYEKIENLRNVHAFKSWLIKILINKCKTELSKSNNITYLNEDIEIRSKENYFEKVELLDLIAKLPEEFKTVIVLFYFNDLPYKEIAEILDICEGTVKSRLFRAKSKLQEIAL
ncbi:RNA polymerase sigma factor [Clostridium tetani]|uniref:RNA polymerase sigma factor n=1 Tax=Clostridium tetani TaxID=1513 RepID=A0ABY0EMY9_CLOTA|nr:RNA polymerase sigma factor [Clostridium tetani]RXI38514.1 RNA polymerase sigma factor [Clostridium tetani]RXI54273.1 RNA polymerase sigma factor [Clostridium tetani]RXI68935.1 RNA polymerase sigma factor [Clostridium tetani]CDI48958.1 ECF subfamily RNA polymerase sigma-24 factor [Clostridium tetani 12124569]